VIPKGSSAAEKGREGIMNRPDKLKRGDRVAIVSLSSEVWYEERTDFSRAAMGTERIKHREERGYELLQDPEVFTGAR